jgi:hypothetical protein
MPPTFEPDPVIEHFKKDVDRTLLEANRRVTPDQRLRALVAAQRSILELQRVLFKGPSRRRAGFGMVKPSLTPDLGGLLWALAEGAVRFVVVGGVAGAAHRTGSWSATSSSARRTGRVVPASG